MFQNSVLPSVSMDLTHNLTSSLPRLGAWRGLARLEQALPLPGSFREYMAWLVVMLAVSGLAGLQVWATLQISVAESQVYTLRAQHQLIEQANAELLWTISHYTTLERVEQDAVAMGYVPTLHRRYVTPQAIARTVPAATAAVTDEGVTAEGVAAESVSSGGGVTPDAQSAFQPGADGWGGERGRVIAGLWQSWTEGWSESWTELSNGWIESVRGLGADWGRAFARFDLSNYQWIGQGNR